MKIHLLCVADTHCENIGIGCGVDVDRMHQFFEYAAQTLEVPLEAVTVRGDLFRRDVVEREVEALDPGEDDVVVFYYSGHGFRTTAKQERWPYLAFDENSFDPVKGLAADAIFKQLEMKTPRLLIVLSDCCNSYMSEHSVDVATATRSASVAERIRHNLERLFVKARGSIIATSSEPGEYAIGTSIGGLFTIALLEAAEMHIVHRKAASWAGIFRDGAVVHEVPQNDSGVQTPVYKIDLGSNVVRSWTLRGRSRPTTRQHESAAATRSVKRVERSTWRPWLWLLIGAGAILGAGIGSGYPGYAVDAAALIAVTFCGTRGYRMGFLEGVGQVARWVIPWLVASYFFQPATDHLATSTGWEHESAPLVVFGALVLLVFWLISFILRRVADGHAASGLDAVLGFVFSAFLGVGSGIMLLAIAAHFGVDLPDSSHFVTVAERFLPGQSS